MTVDLDEMYISLRLADDRIKDVLDRLPEREQAIRDLAGPFLGDEAARTQQTATVRRRAEQLSTAIGSDRATLGQAAHESGQAAHDLEQAGGRYVEALGPGTAPDEAVMGRLSGLRNAIGETSDDIAKADQRLGQVQEGLRSLDSDTRLNSTMDGFSQSKGVREIAEQGHQDLGDAGSRLTAGSGRLGQLATDRELLDAQKGFNPTARDDQHIVADQGSRGDLTARIQGISAALDGWDR